MTLQFPDHTTGALHLHQADTSVLLTWQDAALPAVAHWGESLGELDDSELQAMIAGMAPLEVKTSVDRAVYASIVPEGSGGWMGRPGLDGHRSGRDWSTRFRLSAIEKDTDAERAVFHAEDTDAGLALSVEVEVDVGGLLRVRAALTNLVDEPYSLTRLSVSVPVPAAADELLDFTGLWGRERTPQWQPIRAGTQLRESRRGRTGADAEFLMIAGRHGFDFRRGRVAGVHLGYSGNRVLALERLNTGATTFSGGELLLPGEVSLARGDRYETPWFYASHGEGFDELSARFHKRLRGRSGHPSTARPVTMNSWEAVYFAQSPEAMIELAEAAAGLGVERFVLDDGWFRGRADASSSLGDWFVDEQAWPDGLHPLVERLRELDMQFGLWFEPEMISERSMLAAAHPDWIMQLDERMPPVSRKQQVLNLSIPEAYEYILDRISALVREYRLDYIKWDHNRDLVDAASPSGIAAVHAQTRAFYRVIDTLHERFPALEIESCAAGGSRIDMGVLERVERVWASDTLDALERQRIQRWTGLIVPPEMLGSHVGAERAHSTGRVHDLAFRGGTALMGHFGVEQDVRLLGDEERSALAAWISRYRELRDLVHGGTVVNDEAHGGRIVLRGAVAADRSAAVYTVAALDTLETWPPGRITLPGLDRGRRYRLTPLVDDGEIRKAQAFPAWWRMPFAHSGAVLNDLGVELPPLVPQQLIVLRADEVRE